MQSTCSFDGCVKPRLQHGLCAGHNQQRRKGQELRPLKFRASKSMTLQERLDYHTDKSGDCWVWTGHKHAYGYGVVAFGGKQRYAHRVWFEQVNGPVDPALDVDHMCHNPSCVNPAHLQAVTHKQNGENQTNTQVNNKSGVRGVYWDKARGKWAAKVKHHYREYNIGRFDSLEEAEAAVIAKRNELFTNNLLDRAS